MTDLVMFLFAGIGIPAVGICLFIILDMISDQLEAINKRKMIELEAENNRKMLELEITRKALD